MNLKFFVGWANSFIVCPRGTRYEKPRGHTQRVREPLRGKARPPYALRFMGLNSGEKMAAAVSPASGRGSSLTDLYDPLTMPPALVKAHQALDRAVDACYRKAAFTQPTNGPRHGSRIVFLEFKSGLK